MLNNFENKYNSELMELFKDDPLAKYYNLNGLENIVLTCDIDWAPEYAIESVIETIESFGYKINMFATHDSKVLKQNSNVFNVGIHPNFTRLNSDDFESEVRRLKEMYPDSVGTRSHRNFFGQNISDIVNKYGLIYEASVFLWNQSFCQAHVDYNGMVRYSYFWEDGIHLDTNTPFDISLVNLNTPGLKVLNIHPVLFYLNTVTDDERRAVTSQYSDLTIAPKDEVDKYVNKNYGIRNFYIELLKYCNSQNVKTHFLEDLSYQMLEGINKSTELEKV